MGQSVTIAQLEDLGLLREVFGVWKYKLDIHNRTFFTAASKEDAVEQALKAYHKAKPEDRLTREQREAAAEQAEFERMHLCYGHLSLSQLRERYASDDVEKQQLRKAGAREMLPSGRRSTRAAVANEGARDTAEEMMRLRRYIARRDVDRQDQSV